MNNFNNMPDYNARRSGVSEMQSEEQARVKPDKMRRFVAFIVIFSIMGAPLLGFGVGVGVILTNNYILPRLLDDSDQRMAFSFDNVTNQPLLATSNFGGRHNYVELVELVAPSVVTIRATLPQSRGFNFNFGGANPPVAAGSGIIMYETSTRLYIATNAHVTEGALVVHVSIEGSEYIPASPVGSDSPEDLAVISVLKADAIAAGVRAPRIASFGESDSMRVGDIVIAVGNSMGEGITVTNGIISAVDKEIFVQGRNLHVIQTNAAINQGNSGGPLVNAYGQVIGINTAKFVETLAEGMGYAIPSEIARPILERIMQTPPRPMIGITIDAFGYEDHYTIYELSGGGVELDLPEHAVWVVSVRSDTPAEAAGLLRYDIITHLNGEVMTETNMLIDAFSEMAVGDVVVLTVNRLGDVFDVEVTLGGNLIF